MKFQISVTIDSQHYLGVIMIGDWRHTTKYVFRLERGSINFIDDIIDDTNFIPAGKETSRDVFCAWIAEHIENNFLPKE